MIRSKSTSFLALLLAPLLVLAACGGSDDASAEPEPDGASTETTEASEGDEELDLSGITLRIGDTSDDHVRAVIEASGEGADLPYDVEWATFQNGPALIAAATGGSVDLGKLSETPLVFAQDAGSPVKVVYAARPIDPTTSSLGLLVSADSEIDDLADLEGKKVGFAPGTVLEYFLANALASVDLDLSDVQPVAIQPGIDLVASGDADAIITGTSSLSTAIVNGTSRELVSGAEFTPGYYYLVARDGALEDPALEAAIADFAERLARAEEWFNDNPQDAIDLAVERLKITPEVAADLNSRAPVAYGPIDEEIIETHQAEIDFFVESGVLRERLDATEIFDTRFGSGAG